MFHTEALHLEELLADYGVAVRVGPASLSANTLRFPLQLGLGATVRRMLGLTEQVAKAAGYSHGNLRREGRNLFLELPSDEGVGLRYGDLLEMAGVPPVGSALIGLLEGGEPLMLNVTQRDASPMLVCGGAGSGKSELLRLIGLSMAVRHTPRNWRMVLLSNGTGGPLAALQSLPHAYAWSAHPETTLGWLVRLHTELETREQAAATHPRLLVLMDDADALIRAGGSVAYALLHALLSRGAAVGIHLIIASRSLETVDELLPLLPTRLVAEERGLAGRFLLWGEGLWPIPLTVARLDGREADYVVDRIRVERPRVRARISERNS